MKTVSIGVSIATFSSLDFYFLIKDMLQCLLRQADRIFTRPLKVNLYMKYFKNSATYLLLIYTMTLGLTALLNLIYPSQATSFVEFFLPLDTDISKHAFIRYRMILWLIATIVFLTLLPVMGYFGMAETNVQNFQRIHWGKFVVALIAIPIFWISYPLIALCTTCWTSNDFFYFILTISLFIALQTFAHAIILKVQLIFGKKINVNTHHQ